jgi:hypothetical protein
MSSGNPSTSRLIAPAPPSLSTSSVAQSKLNEATQKACEFLKHVFESRHDDEWIMDSLSVIWGKVHDALSNSRDSNLKQRLRDLSEFKSHVKPGSNRQRELINLVRRMAKGEVPWQDLLTNGTFLFVPLTTDTLIIIFYL